MKVKKLLTIMALLLGVCGGAWADKIGFTSNYLDGKITPPTVTTQDHITVSLVYGSQTTDKNKSNIYWGSTTALSYADNVVVKQNRTKYNGAAVGNSINETFIFF